MTLPGRTRLLALGASAMIAAGIIGAGVAMAQESGQTPTTPGEQATQDCAGPHGPGRGVLQSIVEHSGLSADVFRQGFEDGKTINEILSENGVDPATVQAAVLADIKAHLDERVADGKITQDQADEAYASAEQRVPEFMDSTHELDGHAWGFGGRIVAGLRGMIGSAADALGMQASDLADRIRGRDTIATVANEKGVPVDTVIQAMVADANARIDQAVADGKIDQARADELKANLEEHVTTFVNEGPQHERMHDQEGASFAPYRMQRAGGPGQAMSAFAPRMARFGR